MPRKLTQTEFISRSEAIWGGRYDLSKARYELSDKKVTIVCRKHGEFQMTPNNFLNGHGCPKCRSEKIGERHKKTTEHFIKKAREVHGNRYDYSKVKYVNCHTPVTIICPIHGEFKQTPNNHTSGAGCLRCKRGEICDTKTFIEVSSAVHDGKYDYSRVNYVNTDTPVEIVCPVHGSFFQTPHSHAHGIGCPKCSSSNGEKKVRQFLKKHKIPFTEQQTFEGCRDKRKLKFDFYIPSKNTCIEYQGKQHYEEGRDFYTIIVNSPGGFEQTVRRDQIKREFCKRKGIRLIEIKYNENINEKLKQVI